MKVDLKMSWLSYNIFFSKKVYFLNKSIIKLFSTFSRLWFMVKLIKYFLRSIVTDGNIMTIFSSPVIKHCVKHLVRIRSYSGSHFPAFGLNTKRYSVSLRIKSEGGENMDQNNSEYRHFSRSVWVRENQYSCLLHAVK